MALRSDSLVERLAFWGIPLAFAVMGLTVVLMAVWRRRQGRR